MRVLYQVDTFTTVPFFGNPASVVLDADGMVDAEMLAVARELKNSETAFVFPAEGPDHDLRVRFFTPSAEVPTCGHATVGTHFARAMEYGLPSGVLVQKTGGGLLQRVEIHREGDRVQIRMYQGHAEFGPELDGGQVDRLLGALELPPPIWRTADRCRSYRPGIPRSWWGCEAALWWTSWHRTWLR